MRVIGEAADGLEAARRILQASLATSVLMLTTFDDDEYIYRGALIDPLTTRRLIGRFTRALQPARAVPSVLSELTDRELDVHRLVAEGLDTSWPS
jgi:DNA-binding NarL/FixJ family response regulator